jgi:PAS domain S-box-containing protein
MVVPEDTGLRQISRELQTIIDSIPAYVFVKDKQNRFVRANRAFAASVGVPVEKLPGSSAFDLFPPELAEKYWADDLEVIGKGEPRLGIVEKGLVEGGEGWFSTDKIPHYGDDGEIVGVIGIAIDITRRKERDESLQRKRNILGALSRAQARFIADTDARTVFEQVLTDFLSLTQSEYGFLSEVHYSRKGESYLKTHALTNIAWDSETRAIYEKSLSGGIEFFNLDTLFGAVMITGEPVIANDPARDTRSGGLPEGHPPLDAFLGLPMLISGKLVGVIGMANRPGGYDEGLVQFLRPLTATCANIIAAHKAEVQRKISEEQVEQQKDFLQKILSSLTHPFYVIDANDYTIKLANTASSFTEVPEGTHCYELTHRQSEPCRGEHPCPLREVRETKKPVTVEHVHYDRQGEPRLYEVNAYPLFDRDGDVEQVIEYSLDITRRKKAEEALKDSEGRLKSFYDAAFEAIAISDEERLIDVNPKFTEMFGYSREEVIGRSVMDLVAEEDREMVLGRIRSGYDKPYEHRGLRKDGTVIFLEVHGQTIESDGRSVRVVNINDITERRRSIEELRKSEEKYRTLFEESKDSLFVTTPGGRIVDANQAAVTLLGLDRKEDLLRLDLKRDVYADPGERDRFLEIMRDPEFVDDFETVLKRTDGQLLTTRISGNAVHDERGEQIVYRVAVRDITAQKRLQTQLHHAQKMESIGTLAGGIAHDFNNILTPIMAHVGYLQLELPQENPLREDLGQILQAAERARDLVKQILAFSRREESKRRPVALQPLLKETKKLLRATFPSTIDIRDDIDPACGNVLADSARIHQVLMNLGTNAHHAMRDGGGILRLGLEMVDAKTAGTLDLEPGEYARITVSDTGEGMDKMTRARIFEPYFTTKGAGEGSGLGLAVVHGIVASHKGTISVESLPGEGSTFRVYLPLSAEGDCEAVPEEAMQVSGGSERILFVDDEAGIIAIGERILSSLGYRVTSFTSSLEALKRFRSSPDDFDLVVTDQTIPQMTGIEFAGKVLETRPETPVIICTGFSRELDEEMVREHGARGLIMKPFTVEGLAGMVRRVLDSTGT